jgi:hypothetical protein
MRDLITKAKTSHDSVMISHDSVMQEETRIEEIRIDKIRKEEFNINVNKDCKELDVLGTEENRPKGRVYVHENEFGIKAAELLFNLHKQNIDNGYTVTKNSLERWAKDINRIISIDKRSEDDVLSVIQWVKTPGCFWSTNIMSGDKLRKQFSRLLPESRTKKETKEEKIRRELREAGLYDD